MPTLEELKRKYSGQLVPDWELEEAGLKPDAPKPAKKRAPKVEEEPSNGDSAAIDDTGA